VIKHEHKAAVQKAIQGIFRKIKEPLENQLENFPIPRCGGRETAPEQINNKAKTDTLAHNPQDAGPAEPPKRHRRITISYAGAVKANILRQPKARKI
jgi:hypothetical protein